MDYRTVDGMIRDFSWGIHPPVSLLFSVERHDWKPLFSLAQQIQAEFSGGLRYPTLRERDEAWRTFDDARKLLHERSTKEWEAFGRQSKKNRDNILGHVKYAGYSYWNISSPTPDDMRDRDRLIKEAAQKLERHWSEMLHEHRQECKRRFSELREEHSEFWRRHKEQQAAAYAEVLAERTSRKEEALEKLNEALARKRSQLDRKRSNLEANIDRLAQTRNPAKAREISGWIADGEKEMSDILDDVRNLEEKIESCEAQLRELQRRQR
jgi:uncharacterized coiled-coil protein SlyX